MDHPDHRPGTAAGAAVAVRSARAHGGGRSRTGVGNSHGRSHQLLEYGLDSVKSAGGGDPRIAGARRRARRRLDQGQNGNRAGSGRDQRPSRGPESEYAAGSGAIEPAEESGILSRNRSGASGTSAGARNQRRTFG